MGGQTVQAWLLYDGDCGFCRRWCDWVSRRGADRVVRFEPCHAAQTIRREAGIDDAECADAAFLVEMEGDRVRSVSRGAAAINGVLRMLPSPGNRLLRLAGRIYRLPILRQIEDVGYRLIARNRHRLGSESCGVEKAPSTDE